MTKKKNYVADSETITVGVATRSRDPEFLWRQAKLVLIVKLVCRNSGRLDTGIFILAALVA